MHHGSLLYYSLYSILYHPLYYDPQKDQKMVFFHHQMAGTWNMNIISGQTHK